MSRFFDASNVAAAAHTIELDEKDFTNWMD